MSSPMAFSPIMISKTRFQAHGSLHAQTRSSSQSAFCATTSRPVYPVHPAYPCSQMLPTGLTGPGPCSRKAMKSVVTPSNDRPGRAGTELNKKQQGEWDWLQDLFRGDRPPQAVGQRGKHGDWPRGRWLRPTDQPAVLSSDGKCSASSRLLTLPSRLRGRRSICMKRRGTL